MFGYIGIRNYRHSLNLQNASRSVEKQRGDNDAQLCGEDIVWSRKQIGR